MLYSFVPLQDFAGWLNIYKTVVFIDSVRYCRPPLIINPYLTAVHKLRNKSVVLKKNIVFSYCGFFETDGFVL